jgi:hypothetical protein
LKARKIIFVEEFFLFLFSLTQKNEIGSFTCVYQTLNGFDCFGWQPVTMGIIGQKKVLCGRLQLLCKMVHQGVC